MQLLKPSQLTIFCKLFFPLNIHDFNRAFQFSSNTGINTPNIKLGCNHTKKLTINIIGVALGNDLQHIGFIS